MAATCEVPREVPDYKQERANARLSTLHQKQARFSQATTQNCGKNLPRSKHARLRKGASKDTAEVKADMSRALKERVADMPARCRKTHETPQAGKRKHAHCTSIEHAVDAGDSFESLASKVPSLATLGDYLASKVGAEVDEQCCVSNATQQSQQLPVVTHEPKHELETLHKLCSDLCEHGSDGSAISILRIMDSQLKALEIQRICLHALEVWACKKGYRAIVDVGAVPVLISVMNEHRDSEDLQQACCNLARRITTCSVECRASMASAGGVPAVLAAMSSHIASAGVQEAGCHILKEFAARKDDIQNTVAACSGFEAVLKAMDTHTSNADIQSSACGVLRNMSAGNTGRQDAILALGGLQRVRKLMMEHSQCPLAQSAGIWTLFCLALQNATAKAKIVSNGCVALITHAMTTHNQELKVQEAAFWALKELSCVIRTDTMRSDCIQTLSCALSTHNGEDLNKVGRVALRKLLSQNQCFSPGDRLCKRRRCRTPMELPTISE